MVIGYRLYNAYTPNQRAIKSSKESAGSSSLCGFPLHFPLHSFVVSKKALLYHLFILAGNGKACIANNNIIVIHA